MEPTMEPVEPTVDEPETPEPVEEPYDPVEHILGEEPPSFIDAQTAIAENEGVESFSVSKEQMGNLAPHAEQLLWNLRRVVTQRTQAIAEERKTVATERQELAADRERFIDERSQLFNAVAELRSARKEEAGEEATQPEDLVPGTEEWLNHHVNQLTDARFDKFLTALGDIGKGATEQYETAQAEAASAAALAHVNEFIEAHPDFGRYEDAIEVLVQKHNMSLSDAYDYAKYKDPPPEEPETPTQMRRRAQTTHLKAGPVTSEPGFDIHSIQRFTSL
jgi:hypothetical protein